MLSKTKMAFVAAAVVLGSASGAFADQDTDVSLYQAPEAGTYYGQTVQHVNTARNALARSESYAPAIQRAVPQRTLTDSIRW